MTTLTNRANSALVVIDLQNGVVAEAYRRDEVIEVVRTLVEHARREGMPVIWVQHTDDELAEGSVAWRFVDELVPRSHEPVVYKRYRDAFEDTELEAICARLHVGKLVVAGALTDMCVRSTLHGALVRGYDAVLVSDGHTTIDRTRQGAPTADAVIRHTNLYWSGQRAPGRSGGVISSADFLMHICGG
ncbi:isochorismatase [Bordetella genomosp. 9]|uniref:Isochorismatase n=1 Tax=Bordetella genomosp. 9 TaxID=1416803 RepID=A0A261RNU8_9BORD|nr:isochorismatase family protein [Bordetella genomosp. 9]OZI26270.1 isochorismatase [Bordetella genomosp. 9]